MTEMPDLHIPEAAKIGSSRAGGRWDVSLNLAVFGNSWNDEGPPEGGPYRN